VFALTDNEKNELIGALMSEKVALQVAVNKYVERYGLLPEWLPPADQSAHAAPESPADPVADPAEE
jgi:hypothetical protein